MSLEFAFGCGVCLLLTSYCSFRSGKTSANQAPDF
jgi:hypothetical protein